MFSLNNLSLDIGRTQISLIIFPIVDTKNSPTKDLMLLALKIIEHVVNNQDAMKPSVNLSLYIIEVIFFVTSS